MSGIGREEQEAVFKFSREHQLNVNTLPEFLVHVSRDVSEKTFNLGLILNRHIEVGAAASDE